MRNGRAVEEPVGGRQEIQYAAGLQTSMACPGQSSPPCGFGRICGDQIPKQANRVMQAMLKMNVCESGPCRAYTGVSPRAAHEWPMDDWNIPMS